MQVRYYDDPRSGQPHIYGHNVAEYEVEAVLDRPMEDRPGEGRSENRARENGHRPLFTSRLCSRSHSELGLCDHMFGPKSGLNRSILDFKAGFEFGRQLAYKLQQSAVGSFHVQASPARRRDFLGRHGHRKALSDAIRGSDQRQIEFPQRRLEIPTQGLKKKSCSRPLRRPFPRSSFL